MTDTRSAGPATRQRVGAGETFDPHPTYVVPVEVAVPPDAVSTGTGGGTAPVADLLTAFGLIALAELGDKSQLLALSLATRYRWWQVLVGVAVAAALLLGIASALGGVLGTALPTRAIAIGGGVLFLGFAAWTAMEAREDDDEEVIEAPSRSRRSVIITVTVAFVIAELGDKTMLGTAALATSRGPLAVWVGATLGMTVAASAAIAVGNLLHRRLPAHRLHQASALAFALFGVLLLVEGITG